MGRHVSGGGAASGGGGREERFVFAESAPAFARPAWARAMRVSGVGGGGGSRPDSRGGAGAYALDHFIPLPDDVQTLQIEVGAGGAAGDATTQSQAGGNTRLLMKGAVALHLGGGSSYRTGGKASGLRSLGQATYSGFTGNAITQYQLRDVASGSLEWMARRDAALFDGDPGWVSGDTWRDSDVRPASQNACTPFGGIYLVSGAGYVSLGYGYGGDTGSGRRDGGNGILYITFLGGN